MWHRISPLLLASALLAVAAPLAAQSLPSQLDAEHSYATLWMGRDTETTVIVNVGVARLAGKIHLVLADPATSALHFSLVPGGEGSQLLASDGTLRPDVVAPVLRYTAMEFRSTRARVRHDGRLAFTGELRITHVTRELIPIAWNSGNNSQTYTDPETSQDSATVTFVLATPRAEFLTAYLQKNSELLVSATINAEAFLKLPAAILDSYWPAVIQDEHCEPSTASDGEKDYRGILCPGKAITTTASFQPARPWSKDYSGQPRHDAPPDGPVTLLLHLKLPAQSVAGSR